MPEALLKILHRFNAMADMKKTQRMPEALVENYVRINLETGCQKFVNNTQRTPEALSKMTLRFNVLAEDASYP